jgi:hypothetical protein
MLEVVREELAGLRACEEVRRSHTILLTAECCPTLQVFFAVKSNSSQARLVVLLLQCAGTSKLLTDEVGVTLCILDHESNLVGESRYFCG